MNELRVIKNFAKEDCIHYKQVRARGCCGRSHMVGVCLIVGKNGLNTPKTCSTGATYCNYQPKEEDYVYS